MVDALASVALETLRDLLIKETDLLSSVSYQVEQVERDLRSMHSLLIDADKWSGRESNTQRNWINDLGELAKEAETVLEKYAVEVKSRKEGRTLKRKLNWLPGIFKEGIVHEVVKEAEGIRSRLASLMDKLKSMPGVEGGSSSSDADRQQLLRQRFAHEVEEHFVGMEKDIESLVSMVKDEEGYKSPVVAICGMGGLGKTTLARKIYHHEDVRTCFKARAWVCVTQEFQDKTILREVLRQFLGDDKKQEINNMERPELVEKIHKFMSQKKCLVVVDDIWERDHWDALKPAFPRNNSKVLLTTRMENIVAQDCVVYELDFLTEDQGWELLRKTAVRDDHPGLKTFEDIGRQMVKKCGRLPLAIYVVGGILRQKETSAEWERVSGNIDSFLKLGEGLEEDKRIFQVLNLSYDVLPYYLKLCFLYLACFPEDEEIHTEELYLLWIAEGLISSQDKGRNETLRDVAERYLSELVFRCMVRVQKDEDDYTLDKFTSCRLHDLMRDLSLSKAEEINFLKRLSFPKQLYGERPSSIVTSRLVMCFEAGDSTILSTEGIQKLKDLKSLLILSKKGLDMAIVSLETIIDFGKSKGLRILRLSGCQIEGGELSRIVDKLIHLRCLNLDGSNVEELPASICDMPYLETLDLRVHGNIKLHNVIYKMKKLRHLFLMDFSVIGGDGGGGDGGDILLKLDGLKELETLFSFYDCDGLVCIADIPKLTNLRSLDVQVMDMESASILAPYMCNNKSLLRESYLHIKFCNFISPEGKAIFRNILMSTSIVYLEIDDCEGCGFPSYEQEMCKNLVTLHISRSMIEGDLMGILGKYPMLQKLHLSAEPNRNMICVANSFRELRSLTLENLDNLRKWEVEERAMPKLTELNICNCRNLEGLPLISTLRELWTNQMPKEFNDKLRVVNGQPGEDYHKVSHISSVRLGDE